ncbi:MAG: hypothetical protein ISR69_01585 [Gammaproteobacteria bacterium]|nr:hypothetical protein [Gammaproteobacteria bacterium]
MPVSILRFLISLFLFFSLPVYSEAELEYELDPYYSNVGLYVPFTDESIPTVTLKNEREIYFTLFKDVFTPRFFVAEVSVNPLPILGVHLRDQQNEFYNKAQVTDDLNLISALTEGFEEPYAIAFFMGNIIKFNLPGEENSEAINKGFSGLVFGFGNKHIRNNTMFDDDWYEVEWKLKGDRRLGDIYHSFSFRVGVKNHSHVNIDDSYFFGVRRQLFNSAIRDYDLMDNTGVDVRIDISRNTDKLIQAQLFIEKRWPEEEGEYTFGIGLKQVHKKYLGSLDNLNQEVQLMLRPGFKF